MLREALAITACTMFALTGLQKPAPVVVQTSTPTAQQPVAGSPTVTEPATQVRTRVTYVQECHNGVCRLVPRLVQEVVRPTVSQVISPVTRPTTQYRQVEMQSAIQSRTLVYQGVPITLAPNETLVAVDGVPVSETYRNWGVRGQPVRNIIRGTVRCVGNVCGVR